MAKQAASKETLMGLLALRLREAASNPEITMLMSGGDLRQAASYLEKFDALERARGKGVVGLPLLAGVLDK